MLELKIIKEMCKDSPRAHVKTMLVRREKVSTVPVARGQVSTVLVPRGSLEPELNQSYIRSS